MQGSESFDDGCPAACRRSSKTVFVEELSVITTFYWTIIIILLKFGLVELGLADAIKSIYLYDLGKTIVVLYTLSRRTHAHPLLMEEILSAIWFLTPRGIEIATETDKTGLRNFRPFITKIEYKVLYRTHIIDMG